MGHMKVFVTLSRQQSSSKPLSKVRLFASQCGSLDGRGGTLLAGALGEVAEAGEAVSVAFGVSEALVDVLEDVVVDIEKKNLIFEIQNLKN